MLCVVVTYWLDELVSILFYSADMQGGYIYTRMSVRKIPLMLACVQMFMI